MPTNFGLHLVWSKRSFRMLRFENWFDQFWELVKPIFRGFKTAPDDDLATCAAAELDARSGHD